MLFQYPPYWGGFLLSLWAILERSPSRCEGNQLTFRAQVVTRHRLAVTDEIDVSLLYMTAVPNQADSGLVYTASDSAYIRHRIWPIYGIGFGLIGKAIKRKSFNRQLKILVLFWIIRTD
jgi:hypothetical protein